MVVDDKPFLILGAELQNSSMTSADYMKTTWPKLQDMNINTVLGCVTWEMIEPSEGKFEFAELDKVIQDARDLDLHLILLWFGAFKNGMEASPPQGSEANLVNRQIDVCSILGQERCKTLPTSQVA